MNIKLFFFSETSDDLTPTHRRVCQNILFRLLYEAFSLSSMTKFKRVVETIYIFPWEFVGKFPSKFVLENIDHFPL